MLFFYPLFTLTYINEKLKKKTNKFIKFFNSLGIKILNNFENSSNFIIIFKKKYVKQFLTAVQLKK